MVAIGLPEGKVLHGASHWQLSGVSHITSAHRALVVINHMATDTTDAILLWAGGQKLGIFR